MILALDASGAAGSVALVEDEETVREIAVETPRGRGGALFAALEEILSGAGPLERVVVGIGPGSYNGIRSAIAVAWGIAQARQIPLVGLSSLLGLDEGDYSAVGDARRGQFYLAAIRDGKFVREPGLLEQAELLQQLEPGRIYVPEALEILPQATVRAPDATRLARLGRRLEPAQAGLEPLYLKPAHITKSSRP